MSISKKIARFWTRHFDYDKVGERKILKSIRLYHSDGPLKNIDKLRALILWNRIRKYYNCNIYPGATYGKNLRIVHSTWVTIGKTAVIGDNCRIYPRVDVIAKGVDDDYSLEQRRHPKIGNDCMLGNGCTLIGPITVGDDCIIGARAIVTKDIPPHSVVIGTNQVRPKRPEEVGAAYRKALGYE